MSGSVSTPQVTVVVPTRNRLALLREAVASVERQTFADWELVVVDDASDDGTREWLEQSAGARVRTLALARHSERTVARNRGLDAARGSEVMFLDDDDRLVPDALALLSGALARHPQCVAAVGAAVRFDPYGGRERARHPRRRLVRHVWREVLAGWDSGSGQALFRSEPLRRAGGWNERLTYWELGDLWIRVATRGPVAFVPETILELRLHGGQTRPDPSSEDRRECFLEHLSESERADGERIVRARAHVLAGDAARLAGHPAAALRHYVRAIATAPLLARSPLTRSDVLGNMATVAPRALVGRRGRAAARSVRGALWRGRGP
ncbi:MAG: glycosyltransferase family 2 protein [Thermoleophilia bacterium]|nr:glycosyltransferase family 2 protein [Thermoleophilia bacterium]